MHNLEEACKGVDIAVLLSGLPKKSTKDFEARSKEMYSAIGRALNEHASQHVKVGGLVVLVTDVRPAKEGTSGSMRAVDGAACDQQCHVCTGGHSAAAGQYMRCCSLQRGAPPLATEHHCPVPPGPQPPHSAGAQSYPLRSAVAPG
jgi:hypothetical protein